MPKLTDSGFDRVAAFYDQLAHLIFGSNLERAQGALLPHIPDHSSVLLIGGGTGWLLKQLLATRKNLSILYLEASPAMLRKARQRFQKYGQSHQANVTFRLGTEQTLQPHEQFNIIITPFLLDLFPEKRLYQLMTHLKYALAPNGLWLFTDFWPVKTPAPMWQRAIIKGMYTFFGALSEVKARQLPDYQTHFEALHLHEKYSYTFLNGLVQSKVYGEV